MNPHIVKLNDWTDLATKQMLHNVIDKNKNGTSIRTSTFSCYGAASSLLSVSYIISITILSSHIHTPSNQHSLPCSLRKATYMYFFYLLECLVQ